MRDSPVIEKNGKFESFTQKRPHLFAARARCLSKGEVLEWYDRINQGMQFRLIITSVNQWKHLSVFLLR